MNGFYRIFNLLLITGFLLINLSGCATTQSEMLAASDEDMDSGLGGTGKVEVIATTATVSDDDSDGGIGGTGIIGVITGFGSIFVNGIEVEYDASTMLTIDGRTADNRGLQVGDVVEVLTADSRQHTQAMQINLRHEVIGKVESVDAGSYSFTVKGQSIVQAVNKAIMPKAGQSVAVSGFRIDNNTILATRVTGAEGMGELLRSKRQLPFEGRVSRWRVQTYVKDRKAVFYIDGTQRMVTVEADTKNTLADRLGIKVMQLQRSDSGQLKIRSVVEQGSMPRGRPVSGPMSSSQGNSMQRNGQQQHGGSMGGEFTSPYGANGGRTMMPGPGRLINQGTGFGGSSIPGNKQMKAGQGKR